MSFLNSGVSLCWCEVHQRDLIMPLLSAKPRAPVLVFSTTCGTVSKIRSVSLIFFTSVTLPCGARRFVCYSCFHFITILIGNKEEINVASSMIFFSREDFWYKFTEAGSNMKRTSGKRQNRSLQAFIASLSVFRRNSRIGFRLFLRGSGNGIKDFYLRVNVCVL